MASVNILRNLQGLRGDRRVRYLAVGGINTVVGYLCGLALYYSLSPRLHIVVIGLIANVVCITFSFLGYKFFVFQTRGNWLREYLRCYAVYGGAAAFGIAAIWFLVDHLHVPFWLAQAGIMALTVVLSYLAHSRFSFASSKKKSR